jgi:hypothetical protein
MTNCERVFLKTHRSRIVSTLIVTLSMIVLPIGSFAQQPETGCTWTQLSTEIVTSVWALLRDQPDISASQFKKFIDQKIQAAQTDHAANCTARYHHTPGFVGESCECRESNVCPAMTSAFRNPRSFYWQWVLTLTPSAP